MAWPEWTEVPGTDPLLKVATGILAPLCASEFWGVGAVLSNRLGSPICKMRQSVLFLTKVRASTNRFILVPWAPGRSAESL